MEWLSNFGMREWLISCGIVLVLVVLVDGFRRMRAERKGEIKMARRMGGEFPELPDDEPFSAELPNGGARVKERGDNHEHVLDTSSPLENNTDTTQAPHEFTAETPIAENSVNDQATQAESAAAEPSSYTSTAEYVDDTQLIVIHAKSKDDNGFNGSDLLEVLLACDCRYGDHDILHRYETVSGGEPQFSVANMVEPGTFSLEDISSFRTPGVTFFMALPGPSDADEAFTCMIETANCLAKNLGADLLDDSHATLTSSGIQSYRERVQSFQSATSL